MSTVQAERIVPLLRQEWGEKSHIETLPVSEGFVQLEFEHWTVPLLARHGLYSEVLGIEAQDYQYVKELLKN